MTERKAQFDLEDAEDKKTVNDANGAIQTIDLAVLRLEPQAAGSDALRSALDMLSVVTADLEETVKTTSKAIEDREAEFTKYYHDAVEASKGLYIDTTHIWVPERYKHM